MSRPLVPSSRRTLTHAKWLTQAGTMAQLTGATDPKRPRERGSHGSVTARPGTQVHRLSPSPPCDMAISGPRSPPEQTLALAIPPRPGPRPGLHGLRTARQAQLSRPRVSGDVPSQPGLGRRGRPGAWRPHARRPCALERPAPSSWLAPGGRVDGAPSASVAEVCMWVPRVTWV